MAEDPAGLDWADGTAGITTELAGTGKNKEKITEVLAGVHCAHLAHDFDHHKSRKKYTKMNDLSKVSGWCTHNKNLFDIIYDFPSFVISLTRCICIFS